jgi:hypothetical protein
MTDRELIIGPFNTLGTYVQRTIGETFLLCIEDSEGNIHQVYPDTSKVTWFNERGEAVPPRVDPPGYAGRHCLLHGERGGRQQGPQLTAAPSAIHQH